MRTLGEKETYKYFIILEVDIIKHAEMKEKIRKVSKIKQGNFSKPCSTVGTSPKV